MHPTISVGLLEEVPKLCMIELSFIIRKIHSASVYDCKCVSSRLSWVKCECSQTLDLRSSHASLRHFAEQYTAVLRAGLNAVWQKAHIRSPAVLRSLWRCPQVGHSHTTTVSSLTLRSVLLAFCAADSGVLTACILAPRDLVTQIVRSQRIMWSFHF